MITLLCGPPGSGKTTYIKNHIVDGDIIIDFDLLYRALTLAPDHGGDYSLFNRVNDCRNYLIESIPMFNEVRNTWIIIGAPSDDQICTIKNMHGLIIFIDEDKRTCMRRCANRPGGYDLWKPIVEKWFANHDGKYDEYKLNELH